MSPDPRDKDARVPGDGPPGLKRRAVLVGLLGVALGPAACSGDEGTPRGTRTPEPDPDAALVAEVVAGKRLLLAAYDATAAEIGSLSSMLAPLGADHRDHLRELGADPTAAVPSASPTATASPGAVPGSRRDALAALARDERAAARLRAEQCVQARDPALARLLAAIGGCEAAHEVVLEQERDRPSVKAG